MTEIRLTGRELNRIYELYEKISKGAEWESVTLRTMNGSGIGSILTATFIIEHKEIDGDFTVTITDETNW